MIRKTVTAVGCVAALTVGVVACGTAENLSTGQKISRATEGLADAKSLSVTVDLETSADTLMALAEGDDDFTREMADLVADSTIKIAARADKPLKDVRKASDLTAGELVYAKGNTRLFELRLVDDAAFVRADVPQIAKLSGEEMPPVETLKQELPPGAAFVGKFLDGEWVSVDRSELDELTEMVEDATGEDLSAITDPQIPTEESEGTPSLTDATKKKLYDAVKTVLGQGVQVDKKGKEDGADHYLVSAPGQTLARQLVSKLQPLQSEIPGFELPSDDDIADIPNRRVGLDLFIKGDELKKVSLDMTQFDDELKAKGKLAIALSFDDTAVIFAPKNAVKVTAGDLQALMDGQSGSFEDAMPESGSPWGSDDDSGSIWGSRS